MTKFGYVEVIHPYSTEKIAAEKKLYLYGSVKSQVNKLSESYKIIARTELVANFLEAVKQMEIGNSDYAVIEMWKNGEGIDRMNICHLQEKMPKK